ncbi:MAG: hypothetical protein ACI4SK_05650 [Christensenellales bacterium]
MKKSYKQFFHGKNIHKTNEQHKPIKWKPNTYIDTYNAETGIFRSRRKFGKDGWAYKDMDTADSHRPHDHIHDWNGKQRAKEPRAPNKQEKNELKKAKRKRRFL